MIRIVNGERCEMTQAQIAEKIATRAARSAEIPPKPKPNTEKVIALLISKGLISQADIDSL